MSVAVKVATTKASGEPWDAAGGAPDLGICIVTPSNTLCDATRHGVCQDRFECSFPGVIVPNGPFTVWVYDVDLSASDSIGAATCGGKGDEWTRRACTVGDRLTAVTISR